MTSHIPAETFQRIFGATQDIALALRGAFGADRSNNPFLLARDAGIAKITMTDLGSVEAFVEKTGASFNVQINAKRPYYRRRFSLGHEIGHILLGHSEGHRTIAVGSAPALTKTKERERLCDEIAVELLMPRNAVQMALQSKPLSLDGIGELARDFQVSYTAATLRAIECTSEKVMAIFWDSRGGALNVKYVSRSSSGRGAFLATRTQPNPGTTPYRSLGTTSVVTAVEHLRPEGKGPAYLVESRALRGNKETRVISLAHLETEFD